MSAFLRLQQLELRPPGNDFPAVGNVALEHLLDVHDARPTVVNREHDHAECIFELRVLVEIVDDDLRNGIALQLDDDAHAFLVRLVADIGDVIDLLLVDQPGNVLDQRRLVYVVRNLADDNALFPAFDFFNANAPAHFDTTPTGEKIIFDPLLAAN